MRLGKPTRSFLDACIISCASHHKIITDGLEDQTGVGCDWSCWLPGTSDAFGSCRPDLVIWGMDLKHQWLVSDNDMREILL